MGEKLFKLLPLLLDGVYYVWMNLLDKKMYLPLLLVETYLLFTVWLLYFGPLIWPLENQSEFLTLIALYHLSFILGYCLYIFFLKKKRDSGYEFLLPNMNSSKIESLILNNFWIIVILAFICSIISHRNITHSSSYIPWNFFSDFYNGLTHPGEVRRFYASASYGSNFSGNKFITSLLLFISVFKYSLLPILIYLWHKLGTARKVVGVMVLIIPLVSGVTISLSAINFYYIFIMGISFVALALTHPFKENIQEFKKRKFLVLSFIFLFFFSFWHFYFVKSEVSIYQVLFEKQTPTPFSYLKDKGIVFKSDLDNNTSKSVTTDFYEKLTVYLVQGYQGMSISLGEEFQTTYGIGHSVFLQKVFDKHLGFNIGDRTFQRRISDRWHESVFWHSAYSSFANDVSFPGVCVVMFLLGGGCAMVYTSAVIYGNFFAKLLLPMFGLIFLYMPANNQVFSFLETMSSFWILVALFLISIFRSKNINISNLKES